MIICKFAYGMHAYGMHAYGAENTWSCLFYTLTPINTGQIKKSSLAYDKNANYSYVRYERWNSTNLDMFSLFSSQP